MVSRLMKKKSWMSKGITAALLLGITCGCAFLPLCTFPAFAATGTEIILPAPETASGLPVMQALQQRKSSRRFADASLTDRQLSLILWAANGINRPQEGKRVNPVARRIYNVDVYAVLPEGIYLYQPAKHALAQVFAGDFRPSLSKNPSYVQTAPLTLVYVANPVAPNPSRPVDPVKQTGFDNIAAGAMTQSVALIAVAENLGTCVQGSFETEAFRKAAALTDQKVLISQTVGVLP